MNEAVIIGGSSWNTLVTLDALPEPRPHTVTAVRHHTAMGGTSAGKALHLADLGVKATIVTVLGDDSDAEHILRELSHPSIEVIAIRGAGPSEHHLNLMTRRGERLSIYLDHAPTARHEPETHTRIARSLDGARVIALDLSEVGRTLIPESRTAPGAVWVDLHDYDGINPYHTPFLEAATVILMNGDSIGDSVPFLRARVHGGIVAGVCTLGADGAVGVTSGGTVMRVPAMPARVRDTNGAGDAFMAGMMASSLERPGHAAPADAEELASAMRRGAAQAVRALGSDRLAPR